MNGQASKFSIKARQSLNPPHCPSESLWKYYYFVSPIASHPRRSCNKLGLSLLAVDGMEWRGIEEICHHPKFDRNAKCQQFKAVSLLLLQLRYQTLFSSLIPSHRVELLFVGKNILRRLFLIYR